MRGAFHDELNHLSAALVEMSERVDVALQQASAALINADLDAAESVISADAAIDALQVETEERGMELLARQQPVAGDLRLIITAFRMVSSLERMGDLARHVAQIARMRYPEPALPPEIRPHFQEMADVAHEIVQKVRLLLEGHDVVLAAELDADDNRMDELHRRMFRVLYQDWPHGMETAVDVTLLSRYYERYADHAVSVARRVVQLVTGVAPAQQP